MKYYLNKISDPVTDPKSQNAQRQACGCFGNKLKVKQHKTPGATIHEDNDLFRLILGELLTETIPKPIYPVNDSVWHYLTRTVIQIQKQCIGCGNTHTEFQNKHIWTIDRDYSRSYTWSITELFNAAFDPAVMKKMCQWSCGSLQEHRITKRVQIYPNILLFQCYGMNSMDLTLNIDITKVSCVRSTEIEPMQYTMQSASFRDEIAGGCEWKSLFFESQTSTCKLLDNGTPIETLPSSEGVKRLSIHDCTLCFNMKNPKSTDHCKLTCKETVMNDKHAQTMAMQIQVCPSFKLK